MADEKHLRSNNQLKKTLKKLFELNANGSEEAYSTVLQRTFTLRKMLEAVLKNTGLYAL